MEPKIGHLKEDNRMDRNHLKGKEGDRINALLSGCGANMRKLLLAFFFVLFIWKKYFEKSARLNWWSITYRPYLAHFA